MLNLNKLFESLYCCYFEIVKINIENSKNLVEDLVSIKKQNQLFNLISIEDELYSELEIQKFKEQIVFLCGNCNCEEKELKIELDSINETFDYEWIPICKICIKEDVEWIGSNICCLQYSCNDFEWVGVYKNCLEIDFEWIGSSISCVENYNNNKSCTEFDWIGVNKNCVLI